MKLRNSPNHRWSATEDAFIRLLHCWNQIRLSFIEDGQPFPIAPDRQLLLQLRSIVHPIRFTQTMAQKTKELAVFQVYALLVDAYFVELDDRAPLNIYDPGLTDNLSDSIELEANKCNPFDRLKPTSVLVAAELDPRAIKV
jgi:hypothetical protein